MTRDRMVEILRSAFRKASAKGYKPPTIEAADNYARFVASEMRRMFRENPVRSLLTLAEMNAYATELESGGFHDEIVDLINEENHERERSPGDN